ncbi:hypothetical protein WL1483_2552 [Aeromonas schubertii]|uniref:Uncharacterized protein n=1 Tax=Aeromonas schubertii TaxID=652 RepID=A0A0S2SJX2_9GAMM|nr:hypothetical protein WL1483_2552 [Aeromonas schubertii]
MIVIMTLLDFYMYLLHLITWKIMFLIMDIKLKYIHMII